MSLLDKLREDYKNWSVKPERPLQMLSSSPTSDTPPLQMPKVGQTPTTEQSSEAPVEAPPSDPLEEFEKTEPPKEAPSPQDQVISSVVDTSRMLGVKPTGAGVGSSEPKIRKLFNIAQYPNNTKQINALDNLAERSMAGLTPEQKEFYSTQLNNIRTQKDMLLEKLDAEKIERLTERDRNELIMGVAQGLELIGHGFTRLFAANYGLKKGVDMSGLKFDRFDWEATQARYDKRFTAIIDSIEKKQATVIESSAKESEALIEAQQKQEEGLQKQGQFAIEQANKLRLADQRTATEVGIKEAELGMRGEELASLEKRKQWELNTKMAMQSAARAYKEATDVRKKEEAKNALKYVVLDQIKASLPKDGDVSHKELQEILDNVRVNAGKAGVELAPLTEINQQAQGFLMFGNSAQVLRESLTQEQEALLSGAAPSANIEKPSASTPPINNWGDLHFTQEDVDNLMD